MQALFKPRVIIASYAAQLAEAGSFFVVGYLAAQRRFAAILLLFVVANIGYLARHRWRARQGLDQWPDPHGRYYDEWLALKDVGDYYAWLAQRMGNREPWRTWAASAKKLGV
jgi:hypothetical protein